MRRIINLLLSGLLLMLFATQSSWAIPAFARKYQTSCITCHNVFPQLNSFGEAFKYNGYKFPIDDEEQTKEKQMKLGSEAYKRVWPQAVWPSYLPGTLPLSIRARSSFMVETDSGATTSQFGMPAFQVLAAGALGENISFWVGAHLFEEGKTGSIDNFFLRFNNILADYIGQRTLDIRVGQFIPELVPFASMHRGLTESPYAMNTYNPSFGSKFQAGHVHGAGPFGIEQFQLGVEASGVLFSRMRYVAGCVNGNSVGIDNNSNKDFYGRLAYKIGGLGFDGSTADGKNALDSVSDSFSDKGETSLMIGAFGYKGTGTTADLMDYGFNRIGCDFNAQLQNLALVGGFITGATENADSLSYNLFFGEVQYKFFPWLLGLVRYEQATPKGKETARQVVFHVSSLVVANVKIKAETKLNPKQPDNYNFNLGLEFAF